MSFTGEKESRRYLYTEAVNLEHAASMAKKVSRYFIYLRNT